MTHAAVRVRDAHQLLGCEGVFVEFDGAGRAGDDQVRRYAVISLGNWSGRHGFLSRLAALFTGANSRSPVCRASARFNSNDDTAWGKARETGASLSTKTVTDLDHVSHYQIAAELIGQLGHV